MPAIYADDPLESDQFDVLQRHELATRVAAVLDAMRKETPSGVLAVVGPWGSGKTTLLKSIQGKLPSPWKVALHDPWAYSSLDQATVSFFQEINAALPLDALQPGLRQTIGKWAARIAPLGAMGGVVGVDASTALEKLSALISGDESPRKLRDQASAALRDAKTPVLIVLDDLDRLEPAELLQTFRLVRMLGRLPNLYYLLSYDEETLLDVLTRTDLVGQSAGRARDYLEKMVQVRIDVPELLPEQKLSLFNQHLKAFQTRRKVELTADAVARLTNMWAKCLRYHLLGPRSVNRLMAQFDASWLLIENEVDPVDLLGITFLRTFRPEVLQLISVHREELLARSPGWQGLSASSAPDVWTEWVGRVPEQPPAADAVAQLLAEIFPALRTARDNMSPSAEDVASLYARRGAGHRDFLDRYLQLGVRGDDISDSWIEERVLGLGIWDQAESATDDLRSAFVRSPGRLVRKLLSLEASGHLAPAPFLDFVGPMYLGQTASYSIFGRPESFDLLQLAVRAYAKLDEGQGVAFVDICGLDRSSFAMLGDILGRLVSNDAAGERPQWLPVARKRYLTMVTKRLEQALAAQPSEEWVGEFRNLWAWHDRAEIAELRAVLWAGIGRGPWTVIDVLACLMPVGSTSDGLSTWSSLGDLSVDVVDELLGLEAAVASAGRQLDDAELLAQGVWDKERDATFGTRRQYARSWLAAQSRTGAK